MRFSCAGCSMSGKSEPRGLYRAARHRVTYAWASRGEGPAPSCSPPWQAGLFALHPQQTLFPSFPVTQATRMRARCSHPGSLALGSPPLPVSLLHTTFSSGFLWQAPPRPIHLQRQWGPMSFPVASPHFGCGACLTLFLTCPHLGAPPVSGVPELPNCITDDSPGLALPPGLIRATQLLTLRDGASMSDVHVAACRHED